MGVGHHKLRLEDPSELFMNIIKPKCGPRRTWQVQGANYNKVLLMSGCAAATERDVVIPTGKQLKSVYFCRRT